MEPVGGSTVNAATATNPTASSSRAGGQAPRDIAARPAATPPPPSRAAAHMATVTTGSDQGACSAQGGPTAGRTIKVCSQLLRMTDAAIMIRMALTIPVTADQARPLAKRSGTASGGASRVDGAVSLSPRR